ncbi:MAG: VWA domain-containing protein [Actinomycetota bacterium]|nr:VWA domain-containing protein [Actinomycetota bacterium]MDA2948614.1 VWA domain-containing protein [Actinomycetota bacterium]MDA2991870.1 VWA domain-containing protein [Actinomycetota bacterium]
MTDANKTLIAALLDRSGSMQDIATDMCGGFDSFITRERGQAGATLVTLAQFDDRYDVVFADRPIDAVPALTLEPRGMTALLDAIGRFITEVGTGLAALPEDERPSAITVLVMTDGHENASREWTSEAVRALIAQQESVYGWDFVFLGANMDAVEVGTNLGFAPGKSLTYDADGDAVGGAWDSVSSYTARKRSAGIAAAPSIVFDDAERSAARKRR